MDFPAIFSKAKEWDHVLILSYDLNPVSFFETEILNKLKVNNNITVAIDYHNYRRIISDSEFVSNYLGIYYNLEPIKVLNGGKFHPKFYFFLSNDKAELFVGSANLTQGGFKKNYECLLSFSFDLEDIDDESVDFLIQIMNLLENVFLNPNNLIEEPNDLIKTTIKNILESTFFSNVKELQTLSSAGFKRTYHFLDNTQASLLKQIEDLLGNDTEQLQVLSPFFDDNVDILMDIQSKYKNIDIYIPKERSTFPKAAFKILQKSLSNVSIYTSEKEDAKPRFIHAKIYRFHTQEKIFDFVTSGNFTKAGLFNDNYPRNFEIGILFPGHGEFLSHADLAVIPVKDIDDVITEDREQPEAHTDDLSFDIESAFYHQGKISITFDKTFIRTAQFDEYEISLMLDGIEENRYSIFSDDDTYYFEPSLELEGNQSIRIQLFSINPKYKGVPITVGREKHDPNLLPTLGSSAFAECIRAGGVEGLEMALGYAKASGREDWLIFLLSHWNLERILQGTVDDGEDADGDIDIVPTLRKNRMPKSKKKRIRKNLSTVFGSLDMQKNIADFLDGLCKTDEPFEVFLQKYIKYSFSFIFEISIYFKEILEREEIKKNRSPLIRFPEYTWLYNYKVFYTYVFLICKNLQSYVLTNDLKKIPLNIRFKLISHILLWIHLNTDKTLKEFRSGKYFNRFEEAVNQIFSTVNGCGDSEARKDIFTIFKEHGVSTNILNT
jgi:HKD family nuclease